MLFIFGGLSAVGKTSLAKALAHGLGSAVYLRIDTIEQSLINTGTCTKEAMHDEGYRIAYALATENLNLGINVIADSVNPIEETCQAWRETASSCGPPYIEIEVICPDLKEHQRRAETREPDIPHLALPNWANIQSREFEPWLSEHLSINTSKLSIPQAVDQIKAYIRTALLRFH